MWIALSVHYLINIAYSFYLFSLYIIYIRFYPFISGTAMGSTSSFPIQDVLFFLYFIFIILSWILSSSVLPNFCAQFVANKPMLQYWSTYPSWDEEIKFVEEGPIRLIFHQVMGAASHQLDPGNETCTNTRSMNCQSIVFWRAIEPDKPIES